MDIRTFKADGIKTIKIKGVTSSDMLSIVPLLILYGLTDNDAMAMFHKAVDGGELSCTTSKGVKVICSGSQN